MDDVFYEFANPVTASVRVSVPINDGGEIAGEDDEVAGEKSITFSGTKTAATYAELAYGTTPTNATSQDAGTHAGIFLTFLTYLLGVDWIHVATRRTITQGIEEGPAPSPGPQP